ncbi:MAG: hypothetical protein JW889_08430 [Verrucomicrobia bacterium]|nr:hypothetical protein [Verrucomicrobiota bacterium]
MQSDDELIGALQRLFDSHMHEMRYNEPEYEREALALMREIRTTLARSGPDRLPDIVERHRSGLKARGKAEFSNRLEEFSRAIAPYLV